MSRSSSVILPIPLRHSVGAIWEIIPPAPMQTTDAFEYASWWKPGMSRWRSSAPGMALPTSLIEVLEAVNARRMLFHSFPVNFDIDVAVVHADEPNETIAAEDRHDGDMAGALQPFLKVFVDP